MYNLSEEEVKQVEELLKKLEPGFLPFPIFLQITRLVTTPTIILIPLAKMDNSLKVFLSPREDDDFYWPGKLAVAGSVLLATDKSVEATLERVVKKELDEMNFSHPPKLASYSHHQHERGKELSLIYWAEIENPKNYAKHLYDVNQLPKNMVEIDRSFIKIAVEGYSK